MQIKIIRIENRIVTCELEGGTLIDIAKIYFAGDIQIGDTMEVDISEINRKNRVDI